VGGKGSNHGWPFNEGTLKFPAALGGLNDCGMMTPPTTCKPPEDSYIHGGAAASVTGGLIPPRGCGWGAFEQRYVFGDYNRNIVWTLDVKPDRTGAVPGSRKDFARMPTPVSFRMGPGGALFAVSNGEGSIKRIAPKTVPPTCGAAAVAPDAGAGGAGGGAAGAGVGGTGGAVDTGGSGGGCHCRMGQSSPEGGGGTTLLLALVALLGGRRRQGAASSLGSGPGPSSAFKNATTSAR
jgi:MYXO-CTERM domain-containing protein